ncbi:MAG: hypothetical protein JNM07_02835 [Phycisphaerae bacterium]|nr:hypothetical protein [Phycisphaerae bacterium]
MFNVGELFESGSIPALEMAFRFAGQRQRFIASNIANLTTPDYRPVDASPEGFQRVMREAIAESRSRRAGGVGGLAWRETEELRRAAGSGELRVVPRSPSGNILFHDRNNRDVERLMQSQAENVAMYRVASELLRGRFESLRAAIAERA